MAGTVKSCREAINSLERVEMSSSSHGLLGHSDVLVNETADELEKKGGKQALLGTEPALPLPQCTIKAAIPREF